jgi:hypothetical protein
MSGIFEQALVNLLNSVTAPSKRPLEGGLLLGHIVGENGPTRKPYFVPTTKRTEHMPVMGKTGMGKSSFFRNLMQQDIKAGHGFICFDIHGDLISPTLRFMATCGMDPERVIVIDPTNRDYAVGLNPLEATNETDRFRQIREVTRTIVEPWGFKGARTEELLRNALYVLSENGLTLLELGLLLASDNYRATLLKKVTNVDVREYFELRFDPLSDAMKATMREPVLNKLGEFTSDPHFRFILGQRESTIFFDEILYSGLTVFVNISKGALGVYGPLLGALIYGKLKTAIFRRRNRNLFSVYADELQNLVSEDTDFEVLFSESRKYGVSVVTANQFGAQLPAKLRSAIQAIGTRVFFQLSPEDAEQVTREISGGKAMADRLKNLPPRHFIAKQGHNRPYEVVTPEVVTAKTPAAELYAASNALHATSREDIVRDILARRPQPSQLKETLHDWE